MAARKTATIEGRATVRAVGDRLILPLPQEVSAQLPSRGQVAMVGTLGEHEIDTVIEPDGRAGHWISPDAALLSALDAEAGDSVAFTLTTADEWPEPGVPEDLTTALHEAQQDVRSQWESITPMARWEWVRWVGATRSDATRARRVGVSIDKLRKGSRRPCCFDLASCTDPELSRSGKLLGIE